MSHPKVKHPKELLKEPKTLASKFNTFLAVKITQGIGTMWTAYLFTILALLSLPAILVGSHYVSANLFPSWLIDASLIALVGWIAQTFIQLVLLPIIIVGQNVTQAANDAKAEVDHETLTYLATIQDQQLEILKELQTRGK